MGGWHGISERVLGFIVFSCIMGFCVSKERYYAFVVYAAIGTNDVEPTQDVGKLHRVHELF